MTSELVWLLIGWVTAVPLVWVGFVAYQWLTDLSRRKRFEIDSSLERLRALDRHPSQAELRRMADRNVEQYRRVR
jgi:hypothetical protein